VVSLSDDFEGEKILQKLYKLEVPEILNPNKKILLR
jgi:hypothetical protein